MTCEPYDSIKFLGCSVSSFSSSLGWNEQESTLNVTLVEDKDCNGGSDSFTNQEVGTPASFIAGEFRFDGIIQSYEYREGQSGKIYDVVVKSPTEILEAVQLIIEGYNGTVSDVPNLMNVYGYAESADYGGGFGGAFTNEAGMPWNIIKPTVLLINTGNSPFGSKISFRGYQYELDFSNIPETPDYFRISGANTSLLGAISEVCKASGCDYICQLESTDGTNTIKFKTVSRATQPTLTYIQDFVNSRPEVTVRSIGRELRNDYTSFFTVGGNKERLYSNTFNIPYGRTIPGAPPQANGLPAQYQLATIWPYWGLDRNGNAIIGTGFNDDHTFTVPCDIPGLDVLGGYYRMSVGQLRAALSSFNSWSLWMQSYEPQVALTLGLTSGLNLSNLLSLITGGKGKLKDGRNTQKDRINKISAYKTSTVYVDSVRLQNLYNFVMSYAENYYGKQFMVTVPFVSAKYQSETGMAITSSEPCATGYHTASAQGAVELLESIGNTANILSPNYDPARAGTIQIPPMFSGPLYYSQGTFNTTSTGPLGLPWQYDDLFTDQDGKYVPFVKFSNATNLYGEADENTLVWNKQLYIKAEQEDYFVYLIRSSFYSPRAVVKLSQPIKMNEYLKVPQNYALLYLLLKNNEVSDANIEQMFKNSTAPVDGIDMAPPFAMPDNAAVAIRSNVLTYGPWYDIGVPGKVHYEKNESLVPWNYGGYTAMTYSALANIESAKTNQQEGEVGAIDIPGLPEFSLSDELVTDGPNLTDISCSIGSDGIKTSYRLKTYTPTFGRFAQQYADRLRRIAVQGVQNRRNTLSLLRKTSLIAHSVGSIQNKLKEKDKQIANQGPGFAHNANSDIMYAFKYRKASDDTCVTDMHMGSFEEVEQLINPDDTKTTAMMTLDGLFRGYSVDKAMEGMPHFEAPVENVKFPASSFDFFPFIGNSNSSMGNTSTANSGKTDVTLLTHGSDASWPEEGINTNLNSFDGSKAKGIGFSGPMILTGWGYDLFNKPVPNSTNDGDGAVFPTMGSSSFLTDFRKKSDKWKAGPIDLRWDNMRKVWTFPYLIPGQYNGDGTMTIWKGLDSSTTTNITVPLSSFFNISEVASGAKMLAYPLAGGLILVAADCS